MSSPVIAMLIPPMAESGFEWHACCVTSLHAIGEDEVRKSTSSLGKLAGEIDYARQRVRTWF